MIKITRNTDSNHYNKHICYRSSIYMLSLHVVSELVSKLVLELILKVSECPYYTRWRN